jgi:uncharacterized membrane protein YphA (DoxX/SURF4 family)
VAPSMLGADFRRRALPSIFSSFPAGWPGAGLLLLRAAVAALLILRAMACFMSGHQTRFLFVVALVTVASGALLLGGYLTRLAAVVAVGAGISTMCSWLAAPNVAFFDTRTTAALATVIAAAVVCLGPGAFSLDARLFGRREIIIPKATHYS